METQNSTQPQFRQFSFTGNGLELFKIYIVNWILSVLTLGFYYPWAKASQLKYKYEHTFFEGSHFVFHGTGKEIFRGFIKIVGIFIAYILIYMFAAFSQNILLMVATQIGFMVVVLILTPLALHGSFRYRTSRSSWRGIHFGYRGVQSELVKLFLSNMLLTIITFGLYGSWFTTNLRKYIIGNIKFGNIKFQYKGEALDLFWINLKGILLTLFTFGIYGFWFQMNLLTYLVENTKAEQNGERLDLRCTARGGEFLGVAILNVLIVFFTLGIGFAWAEVRMIKFMTENIWVQGNFDANQLTQTEQEFKDASGDDMLDMLNIDLDIV